MSRFSRFSMGLWLIVVAMLALPLAGFAQDADNREISAYVFTDEGLVKFQQALQNLHQLGDELARHCDDDGADDQSLDGMVARIEAVPGAVEAIESAGMPVREYVVFTFALLQAGLASWMQDQPGSTLPPDTSMANVEFYRAHEAELTSMSSQDPCDESEQDEYGEDEDANEGDEQEG